MLDQLVSHLLTSSGTRVVGASESRRVMRVLDSASFCSSFVRSGATPRSQKQGRAVAVPPGAD